MDMISKEVQNCRICHATEFESVIDFGEIALTGVFEENGTSVRQAPLELIRCQECGLAQLRHSYDLEELYGETYGYESHLNRTMSEHLTRKARVLEKKYLHGVVEPIVVDIASNDGTLLGGYTNQKMLRIGIDPLINVVSDHYPSGSIKINNFFDSQSFFLASSKQADLVTSLSVLYDLDDPLKFANDVGSILKEGGIWHFEQSYLPSMVKTLSYDTICHEHLLYLSLHDITKILSKTGMKILDVTLNSTNGGSIAVTAIKSLEEIPSHPYLEYLIDLEIQENFQNGKALREFAARSTEHKNNLRRLIENLANSGNKLIGIGASTKGNVLLQWLGLNSKDIEYICDVNPRKFGKETPGSGIQIVNDEILNVEISGKVVALVLPWHFREGIIKKSEKFISDGNSLLFPLPAIEIVSA